MSVFFRFYKREKIISRAIQIDTDLYGELGHLSKNTYDASINKLVNACIERLIETKNVVVYENENKDYITRSFEIRESFIKGIEALSAKYDVAFYKLVNISIRNALIEEGILKDKK